jgi:CubicO group peptidase (beta-lactamase class C family)
MDCPGPTLLIAALCAAIGFAAPCAKAAEAPLADAQIREMGRQWLIDNDGIGLSIGIYDDGERWFYNFGTTQLDGSRLPGKDTVYEIGAISRTFAGQLLARAVVEGRAALTDEAARHLDHPYPNLENGGEKVRLQHLVSSTSHLIDNIPDLTQVRAVPQEPLPVTHQRVVEQYTRAEFLRQLTRVMPRQPPGGPPANSNVGAMVLGVALEKIYGDSFENILAREIEKPLRMASGVAPPAKLLARGYTASNEPLPPFAARTQYASLGLRYSAEDRGSAEVRGLADGGARRVGEACAPAHVVDARRASGRGVLLDRGRFAAGTSPAAHGKHLWIRELLRSLPGGEGRGGGAFQQSRGRRAGFPARTVREDHRDASAGRIRFTRRQTAAFVSRRSAAGSLSGLALTAAPLWLMSMLPEKFAPSAMPTRGA